jgi:hypothetical protein
VPPTASPVGVCCVAAASMVGVTVAVACASWAAAGVGSASVGACSGSGVWVGGGVTVGVTRTWKPPHARDANKSKLSGRISSQLGDEDPRQGVDRPFGSVWYIRLSVGAFRICPGAAPDYMLSGAVTPSRPRTRTNTVFVAATSRSLAHVEFIVCRIRRDHPAIASKRVERGCQLSSVER